MDIGMLMEIQGKMFPAPMTNEAVQGMMRGTLSEEEKEKSYAKYFYKDMALIPQQDLDKVNAGPINPELALEIFDAKEMLKEGDLDTEVGYCVMPDGTGFAATKVFMPDVTTEMIDWWFNWHPLEGLRYKIWCPVAHTGIRAETPEAHLDSSGTPLHTRNIGKIHHPIEGFSVPTAVDIEIAFKHPEILGLTQEMLDDSPVTTFQIATCIAEHPRSPINLFFHSIREVEGGIEYRSRYWLGFTTIGDRLARPNVPAPYPLIMSMARNNCIHSLTEYNNLGSILPQLYKEQGGKID